MLVGRFVQIQSTAEEDWPSDGKEATRRGLDALNQRRKERGAGPVVLEDGLCLAAEELAVPLGSGRAQPHAGFPERVRKHGWPQEDMGIRNRGFGNVSEGCMEGGRSPEECILSLDASKNPREGHRQDFEDPAFTHVGIAFAPNRGRFGGYVAVVEYGARKQLPAPDDEFMLIGDAR